MKTRVTLTMAPDVLLRAKHLAHQRKTNVSALIEDFVRKAPLPEQEGSPNFVDKWSGKFQVRTTSAQDPRLAALKERYRLDSK